MKTKDIRLVVILFILLTAISFLHSTIAILLAASLVMLLIFYAFRKLRELIEEKSQKNLFEYEQLESLFSLYNFINNKRLFPVFRGWAISPDFANLIASMIIEKKPKIVLEIGSGVSSLITGYGLKNQGAGKIICFEHLEEFAKKNSDLAASHNLEGFVDIKYTPLKEYQLNGKAWKWYDFEINEKIDLLIIDGPPKTVQQYSRYPALPLLYDKLSPDATIILDDTNRQEEQEIIEMWLKEFKDLTYENIELEKGAVLLRRAKNN